MLIGACTTPGGRLSPDPARLLAEGGAPCRVVFGPLSADEGFRVEERALIESPGGGAAVEIGTAAAPLDGVDAGGIDVDGIAVLVATVDGTATARWQLPPTEIVVRAPALTEAALTELLPELVGRADPFGLSDVLAAAIDGAEVVSAGVAPTVDLDVGYEAGTSEPAEVDAEVFADAVDDLLGAVSVGSLERPFVTIDGDCDRPDGVVDLDVGVVTASSFERDVGAGVSIGFDDPDALRLDVDPLVVVSVGAVDLVGELDHQGRATFDAVLSHAEADLLVEALSEVSPDG